MSRHAKQFIYGVFYLALAAVIVVSALPDAGKEETIVAAPEGARPLEVRGAVTVMVAADRSVALLARVRNPNERYGAATFPYAFRVMRGNAAVLETPRRTGSVHPLETVTLLETLSSSTFSEDAAAEIDVGVPAWTATEFAVRPSLVIVRARIFSDELGAVAEGEIRNASAISASAVRLVVVLKDVNGFPLFAAQTLLAEGIPGGATRPFFVRFPRDRSIFERAAPDGAEFIIDAG